MVAVVAEPLRALVSTLELALGRMNLVDMVLGLDSWVTASDTHFVMYVGCCLVFYRVLHLASVYVFPWGAFVSTYGTLSGNEVTEWGSRVVSNANAGACVVGGLYGLGWFVDASLVGSPGAWLSAPIPTVWLSVGGLLGYLAHDIHLVVTTPNLFSWAMILHHLLGLVSGTYAFHLDTAGAACCAFLVTEATTPFINARWFLAKGGMRESGLYSLNGFAIFLSWLVFRITLVVLPPFVFYRDWDAVVYANPVTIGVIITVYIIIGILNSYWFYLISKGVLKLVGLVGSSKPRKNA